MRWHWLHWFCLFVNAALRHSEDDHQADQRELERLRAQCQQTFGERERTAEEAIGLKADLHKLQEQYNALLQQWQVCSSISVCLSLRLSLSLSLSHQSSWYFCWIS